LLESLKKTSASTPHYWLNKATLYKAQYDFNAALEIYDTLISKYPDFALGYFNKASTMYDLLEMLLRMNNMQGTVSQAGMAKNPQSPALKDVETTNLQLKEVENLLIRSVQIDPDFYYAWFNLALIKTEQKEYEPALDCYTKAIKVNNDFVEAYYNRGLTYLYLENTRKACQDLSKAGELGLNDAYEVIKIYCK
jgi:tetratricopeptide (TPR) repeat protein